MNRVRPCIAAAIMATLAALGGCAAGVGRWGADRPPTHQLEILPFSRVANFDADIIPDGLEILVQPTDPSGQPTPMTGLFQVELFEFVPVALNHRGPRIAFWQADVDADEDIRRWWDVIVQAYRFQLAWREPLRPKRRYILTVTFQPTDETVDRLFDERTVKFQAPQELIDHLKKRKPANARP